MKPLVVLELFCGTKSMSKAAEERGHTTYTVDIDSQYNPDLRADVRKLDKERILELTDGQVPDFIHASPPCIRYSMMSCSHYFEKVDGVFRPRNEAALRSNVLVKHTIQLINDLAPQAGWTMENPRALLRKMPFMQPLGEPHTVTYCQYGDSKRQKPTDFWHDLPGWNPKPACPPGASCHEPAPRGSSTGTQGQASSQDRYVIPHALCLEIIEAAEEKARG